MEATCEASICEVSILVFLDFNWDKRVYAFLAAYEFQSLFSWISTQSEDSARACSDAISILVFLDFNIAKKLRRQ